MLQENQNGFREGRSTMDHVFSLTSLIQYNMLKRKGTHSSKVFCTFVNFREAFDSVVRSLLLKHLKEQGISCCFFNILKKSYRENFCSVKTGKVENDIGVKQGDHQSLGLFLTYIDPLIKLINEEGMGIEVDEINIGIICLC